MMIDAKVWSAGDSATNGRASGSGGVLLALALALGVGACGTEVDDPVESSRALARATSMGSSVTSSSTLTSVGSNSGVGALIPASVDLRATGTVHFTTESDGSQYVMIDVINGGSAPAIARRTITYLAEYLVQGSLNQYQGGSATVPNTVNPGERGYIALTLPRGGLSRCGQYWLILDYFHELQFGTPDPFANDSGAVQTQCLRWDTPVDSYTFPAGSSSAVLQRKSLSQIVGGFVTGRDDKKLCSECHFKNTPLAYHAPMYQGASAVIDPYAVIDGHTWADPLGWPDLFFRQPTDHPDILSSKPLVLKNLIEQWLTDGAQPASSPSAITAIPIAGVLTAAP